MALDNKTNMILPVNPKQRLTNTYSIFTPENYKAVKVCIIRVRGIFRHV